MSNSESTTWQNRSLVPLDDCGAVQAAEIVSDRWTVLILRELFYGVGKFEDICAEIGIPRSVLTGRLNKLLAAGVVRKVAYQEPGKRSRHGYVLTAAGQALGPVLVALMQWGDAHLRQQSTALQVLDESGERLKIGWMPADAEEAVPARFKV